MHGRANSADGTGQARDSRGGGAAAERCSAASSGGPRLPAPSESPSSSSSSSLASTMSGVGCEDASGDSRMPPPPETRAPRSGVDLACCWGGWLGDVGLAGALLGGDGDAACASSASVASSRSSELQAAPAHTRSTTHRSSRPPLGGRAAGPRAAPTSPRATGDPVANPPPPRPGSAQRRTSRSEERRGTAAPAYASAPSVSAPPLRRWGAEAEAATLDAGEASAGSHEQRSVEKRRKARTA